MLIPVPIVRYIAPEEKLTPSPAVLQARAVVASILGSLRDGPHLPDSGLHWAAAYLSSADENVIAVATTDAGWLPPGVLIPSGVRVLWNVPAATAWATVDDPVRQLLEYAAGAGYAVRGIATTHPSRVHYDPADPGRLVGERRLGPVFDGGANRFAVVSSAERVALIRALDDDHAARQARALLRDLERLVAGPGPVPGLDETLAEAGRYLRARRPLPAAVRHHLAFVEDELVDALRADRTSPRALSADSPAPDGRQLRHLLLQRAAVSATRAAIDGDLESTVYAWTFARSLIRQR
ncbi:putative protein OS=Tsukamurella paurometabola (strain ATCC 8368 / DSM / CCUG 35730 /CIP 100753 / JCM 10117 / KCTC 9821 / NBRC 16120 / NCIMB 702349/ NCTC 13040) OX=521096 GN=Tpau_3464 PE=4 SV=1 [Tsukamurella paurometabola]|uniref:Uncharacterized protein n=1 Tax=Tsukamurella paurometabola (strain ATCC 8368 / DSM 20162 / CCUG 35730 / CIP 100753 / JCM 10117 / KCTC 9821 / NBRC 16120 / NCIMB 702349 / NCTC 13040) TaxID=521096 RepID=D5UX26_TSUPD|nr:hypothetical protein [Tsukamurella paurometabola]ADG80045.1 hypothetical protein Tpau_3464 [Tsukamurella paurometabola DSM 20162]SUP38188.1 Uncharacterised protein [Tsukamurella paurometabola]